ncbi:hypothetical protein [Cohnella luojiensis]
MRTSGTTPFSFLYEQSGIVIAAEAIDGDQSECGGEAKQDGQVQA